MDRLFARLEHPVTVPQGEAFVCAPIVDAERAKEHIRHAVTGGVLKPVDIDQAAIDEPRLLWVPFYRVDVSVDGFHFGLPFTAVGRGGGLQVPIPTGGARHKDAVLMICARRAFPFEVKLPSFLGGTLDGVASLEINMGELASNESSSITELAGEVLDADLTREDAAAEASRLVLRAVLPGSALYAKYDPVIRSNLFCRYPVYFARYRYQGEARGDTGEFFVAISARTGKPISAKHPSPVRAAAQRFRKLITFGRG